MKPKITLFNGSLGGRAGNTGEILRLLVIELSSSANLEEIHLSEEPSRETLLHSLTSAQGFVFASGTYWDSWGSPLQKFFEDATDLEATDVWLGKPAATLITMHSVGGKEVLSRLQGVLSTLGCVIPPMSGMVYSLANHLALQNPDHEFHADLWQLGDLKVIVHNLLQSLQPSPSWKSWPVDTRDPRRKWIIP